MKFLGAFLSGLAASVVQVQADFSIYYTERHPGRTIGYSFYNSTPSASDVLESTVWFTKKAVWDVQGIRCNGPACPRLPGPNDPAGGVADRNVGNIDVFEVNVHQESPKRHFTIYRESNWRMIDVNDKTIGQCHPDNSHNYTYVLDDNYRSEVQGWRAFYCESRLTASTLNKGRDKGGATWIGQRIDK